MRSAGSDLKWDNKIKATTHSKDRLKRDRRARFLENNIKSIFGQVNDDALINKKLDTSLEKLIRATK